MFKGNHTRLGWGVVSFILVYDGIVHALTGKVWARIKGAGIPPAMEGKQVVALGIIEALLGLYLLYRLVFRSRE